MGRRLSDADPERVAAMLTDVERALFAGFDDELALPGRGWWDRPGVRAYVTMLAASRRCAQLIATDPELSKTEAMRMAAESLGLVDNSELATHPGDNLSRELRGWQRWPGDNLRTREDGVE
jgi:hypothetical protein